MAYHPQPLKVWDANAIHDCKRLHARACTSGGAFFIRESMEGPSAPFLLHILYYIPHTQNHFPKSNENCADEVFTFSKGDFSNEIAHWHALIANGTVREGLTYRPPDDSVKWLTLLGVPAA